MKSKIVTSSLTKKLIPFHTFMDLVLKPDTLSQSIIIIYYPTFELSKFLLIVVVIIAVRINKDENF